MQQSVIVALALLFKSARVSPGFRSPQKTVGFQADGIKLHARNLVRGMYSLETGEKYS